MSQPILSAFGGETCLPMDETCACDRSLLKNDVAKGAIVERRFEIAAMERGYEVAVNFGGGKDFDCMVRRVGGRPVVVQIKTGDWRGTAYRIRNQSGGRVYSPDAYDVLAVYLCDREQWVFYLRAELGNRSATSYTPPDIRRKKRGELCGRHGGLPPDRNPDNWELLDEVAQSFT